MIKRQHNRIEMIKDGQNWITDLKEISYCLVKKFVDLYCTSSPTFPGDLNGLGNKLLTIEENLGLIRIPNLEEIKKAIWTLHPLESPGPYGYPGIFYWT